jgi:hypothetical protein
MTRHFVLLLKLHAAELTLGRFPGVHNSQMFQDGLFVGFLPLA